MGEQNLRTAENLRVPELSQFLQQRRPPLEKHRRKPASSAHVPEQRQKMIRYGYRNSAGGSVRRPFLIADNLFRLKSVRLSCAQRRYAIRFGKSGTEFTVHVKYQTIPGGKR